MGLELKSILKSIHSAKASGEKANGYAGYPQLRRSILRQVWSSQQKLHEDHMGRYSQIWLTLEFQQLRATQSCI